MLVMIFQRKLCKCSEFNSFSFFLQLKIHQKFFLKSKLIKKESKNDNWFISEGNPGFIGTNKVGTRIKIKITTRNFDDV